LAPLPLNVPCVGPLTIEKANRVAVRDRCRFRVTGFETSSARLSDSDQLAKGAPVRGKSVGSRIDPNP